MPSPQELISQAAALLEQARVMSTPVTADDLATMTPQQINEARRSGRLDNLLSKEN
jgi:hypothetical protein